DRLHFVGGDGDNPAGALHLSAEMSEDLQHVMRVAQVRHAMNRARLPSQQGRGQNGEGGVLRTADLDGTGERIPAMHKYLIHTGRRENAFYLNNRFSPRCRRNFYRVKDQSGPVPGRARSPGRASRWRSDATAWSQSI